MKTIEQLINKLKEVEGNPNKIKKAEFIELGRNIDWIISPKTGNKIGLGTYVAYIYPWHQVHSWEDLSRETLTDLFKEMLELMQYGYKHVEAQEFDNAILRNCTIR